MNTIIGDVNKSLTKLSLIIKNYYGEIINLIHYKIKLTSIIKLYLEDAKQPVIYP